MKITDHLQPEDYRELFTYDPETGSLKWEKPTALRMRHGDEAGCTVNNNGKNYRYVRVRGRSVMAHRIIWAMVYGAHPLGCVDHVNGDGLDNRLKNLRECSFIENSQNRLWRPGNGLIGAHKKGERWTSKIRAGGKLIHLGSFGSREEAHEAYLSAKQRYHSFSPLIRTHEGEIV